jgi:DNA-binding response OmpR family regulator
VLENRPYALVIDRDDTSRVRLTTVLRECGFVSAGFSESRGALAVLAATRIDLAIIAGYPPDEDDALAVASQVQRSRPETKVLLAGSARGWPVRLGSDCDRVVTRPFDKRRFVGAVLALMGRDGDADACCDEAELGIIEAELACLYGRQGGAVDRSAASDVATQIRDAMAARETLRLALGAPVEAA